MSFSDSFNRSDGALGSNWTTVSGLSAPEIASNQVRASAVFMNAALVATSAATFAADQTASVVVSALTAFDDTGVIVRGDAAAATGYVVRYSHNGGVLRVSRFAGSTLTALGADITQTMTNGDVLGLRVTGTTLEVLRNGTAIASRTDSTHATGQPGLAYWFEGGNASRIDEFAGVSATGPSAAAIHDYLTLNGLTPGV